MPNPLFTPLVNGKSYEWADITVNILGVPMVGVTSIEYEERQTMENVYGAGKFPVSRGYGKIEPTAKITLLMEEIEAIQTAIPTGRLMDIPEFDITVTFVDAQLITRTHVIKNVRFMNNSRASATADTSIPVDLELICSHIEFV